jgi:hypothetical protein
VNTASSGRCIDTLVSVLHIQLALHLIIPSTIIKGLASTAITPLKPSPRRNCTTTTLDDAKTYRLVGISTLGYQSSAIDIDILSTSVRSTAAS